MNARRAKPSSIGDGSGWRRLLDIVVSAFEDVANGVSDHGVIVDDQNACHAIPVSPSTRTVCATARRGWLAPLSAPAVARAILAASGATANRGGAGGSTRMALPSRRGGLESSPL